MKYEDIDYDVVLADLEAQRDAIEKAISGIRIMLKARRRGVTGPGKQAEVIEPNAFTGMSIPVAIQKYMEFERKPRAIKDIAQALKAGGLESDSDTFTNTVSSALRRLAAKGIVYKRKRIWILKERKPTGGVSAEGSVASLFKKLPGEAEGSGQGN
jgi:hypothetical protein